MTALPLSSAVAVIGAGTMGLGIAQVAAVAGHPVRLHDAKPGAAAEGLARLGATVQALAAKGKIADPQAVLARISVADALTDLAGCGLVIEAIIEDMEIKRGLFQALAAVVAPEAILATNTSSLSLAALARDLPGPERFVGMHFFNPAPVMALVEVISAPRTSDVVRDSILATARTWGKKPIAVAAAPGFVVNRCARPFYGEAWRLLTEGACDAVTLDAVMREAGGFRLGPAELMDLIGHDISLSVSQSLFEAFGHDSRYAPSWRQRALVEAGMLGRKSGQGLYAHDLAPALAPQPAGLTGPAPDGPVVIGDLGPAAALGERIAATLGAVQPGRAAGVIRIAGATLALTDGRLATERARQEGIPDLVLFDLARDFAATRRLAITSPDPQARARAAGLLTAIGITATPVADTPGLILARTAAQLISEACLVAEAGIADPADIDTALLYGLNYPQGPFGWAEALGWDWVARLLTGLHGSTGEDRYRLPPAVRRRV